MKQLIDRLDQEVKSEFENSIETVIHEMNATRTADPESTLIYLIDAANQIAKLQRIASLGAGLRLHDGQ